MLGLGVLKLMHISLLNVSKCLVPLFLIALIGGSVIISLIGKKSLHNSSI